MINVTEALKQSDLYFNKGLGSLEIPTAVINLLKPEYAHTESVFPIEFTDGTLTLITNNVNNMGKQDELLANIQKENTQVLRLIIKYADYDNLNEAFLRFYNQGLIQTENIANADDTQNNEVTTSETILAKNIISDAIHMKASDIHMTPFPGGLDLQYRVDGKLYRPQITVPFRAARIVVNHIKALCKLDPANTKVPQDGSFTQNGVDFRVNTYPCYCGEKINMRILDADNKLTNIDDIGLDPADTQFLKDVIKTPYGIILMTGPTGHGKSTTLYACIRERSPETNIILSAEDPVEQKITGIAQAQMLPLQDNEKLSLTFSKALRATLRQDPDVIFVGEIRDLETAITAIQASQTGHLLFSTLHVTNASKAIQRLIDIGVERNSILSEMICIISQRLVAKNCPHCKEKIVSEFNKFLRKQDLKQLEDGQYTYKSKGCEKCRKGYLGRKPIVEIIKFDNAMRDFFSTTRSLVETEKYLKKRKVETIWEKGFKLVKSGDISLEELLQTITVDEDYTTEME